MPISIGSASTRISICRGRNAIYAAQFLDGVARRTRRDDPVQVLGSGKLLVDQGDRAHAVLAVLERGLGLGALDPPAFMPSRLTITARLFFTR